MGSASFSLVEPYPTVREARRLTHRRIRRSSSRYRPP